MMETQAVKSNMVEEGRLNIQKSSYDLQKKIFERKMTTEQRALIVRLHQRLQVNNTLEHDHTLTLHRGKSERLTSLELDDHLNHIAPTHATRKHHAHEAARRTCSLPLITQRSPGNSPSLDKRSCISATERTKRVETSSSNAKRNNKTRRHSDEDITIPQNSSERIKIISNELHNKNCDMIKTRKHRTQALLTPMLRNGSSKTKFIHETHQHNILKVKKATLARENIDSNNFEDVSLNERMERFLHSLDIVSNDTK